MFSFTREFLALNNKKTNKSIIAAARRKALAARYQQQSKLSDDASSSAGRETTHVDDTSSSISISSSSHQHQSSSSPNVSSSSSGPPWHRALHSFSQQLFAGQDLSDEVATRLSSVFEQGGSAADFLRWWIVFRCEDAPVTTAEARALLRHNMWKQALYTAAVSEVAQNQEEYLVMVGGEDGYSQFDSSVAEETNRRHGDAAAAARRYTVFGHYAAVSACRSGNWQLALKMCSTWDELKDETIARKLGILASPSSSSSSSSRGDSSLQKKKRLLLPKKKKNQTEKVEKKSLSLATDSVPSADWMMPNNSAQSEDNINSSTWQSALEVLLGIGSQTRAEERR